MPAHSPVPMPAAAGGSTDQRLQEALLGCARLVRWVKTRHLMLAGELSSHIRLPDGAEREGKELRHPDGAQSSRRTSDVSGCLLRLPLEVFGHVELVEEITYLI